jgi:hypothetical protein
MFKGYKTCDEVITVTSPEKPGLPGFFIFLKGNSMAKEEPD